MIVDTEYVKQRNELIPFAEKYANQKCGMSGNGMSESERLSWVRNWNKVYSEKMNSLSKQHIK